MSQVAIALTRAARDGRQWGYKPAHRELWIGSGPDDPMRRTFTVGPNEMEAALFIAAGEVEKGRL